MKIELNVTLTAVDKFYSYMKRVRAHDKNEEYFKSQKPVEQEIEKYY